MPEPYFDLLEEGDSLYLEVALPGVLETDIDVTLAGSTIVIRAHRLAFRGLSLYCEIKRGVLLREISLPCPVELLKSRYEDGVLWLQFRRLEAG